MVKIFTILNGNTSNSHKTFVDHLAAKIQLTEVLQPEECDVILEFCPVASYPGADLDAALRELPANKPAVLVVMHHTYDPNCSVYDSTNYVTRSDTISVDCLFHESTGLLKCPANEEAVGKTVKHIKKYSKERLPVQPVTKHALLPVPKSTEPKSVVVQAVTECETSSKSLMEKISNISESAAENMLAANVSDAQILTITLPEMHELLPGRENFQKRREIMELIRQHAETTSLRQKISSISQKAAESLSAANVSDAQILTITLPEMHELLPGMENFQKRREIMELIRQHSEGQVPGVLPQILKVQETQLQAAGVAVHRPHVQPEENGPASNTAANVSDAQILTRTLPEMHEPLPGMENFQKRRELIRQHAERQAPEVLPQILKVQETQLQPAGVAVHHPHVQPEENGSASNTGLVKVHISGDMTGQSGFLSKLGLGAADCSLQQCRVVLLLCPVYSHVTNDIKAALSRIPDTKDVILVVIHQTVQTWNQRYSAQKKNVVETVHYLASSGSTDSSLNEQAISRLRRALQRYGSL